jgi:hypothetical protein
MTRTAALARNVMVPRRTNGTIAFNVPVVTQQVWRHA